MALVKAIGGTVTQGDGSRVRFDLNNISLNIHSPHPQKELKRYQVLADCQALNKTPDQPWLTVTQQ